MYKALENLKKPLVELVHQKLHRLFLAYFIYSLGLCLLLPLVPTLLTDYFSERHAGHPVQCAGLPSGKEPPLVCKQAHNDVIAWTSIKSLICHLGLSIILTPLLCRWSDYYGRKPFLVCGLMTSLLPTLSIVLYLKYNIPLIWYYPASIIDSSFSASGLIYSYMCDKISVEHRTFVLGLATAPFGAALLLGPFPSVVGWIQSPLVASVTSMSLIFGSIAILLLFVPESLSIESRHRALSLRKSNFDHGWRKHLTVARDYWMSISILFRTKFFAQLTVCVVILYLTFEEVMDTESQYFQEVAGFGTHEQGVTMILAGATILFIQTFVLWFLTSGLSLSNKQILLLGLFMYTFKMFLMAFCSSRVIAYTSVVIGGFVAIIFPSIASIKSAYVSNDEQGAVQGALGGAQALAQGLGPFVFLGFFYFFRQGNLYFAGAPYLFAGVVLVVAAIIAGQIELPSLYKELDTECPYGTELSSELDSAALLDSAGR